MKVETLKKRLEKKNIKYNINKFNDIDFIINGKEYTADILGEQVFCYSLDLYYDNASQETKRIFFDSFQQVIKNANK